MRVMRTYSQTDVEYVKQIEAHKKNQKHNKSFKFLITARLLSQIRKISSVDQNKKRGLTFFYPIAAV